VDDGMGRGVCGGVAGGLNKYQQLAIVYGGWRKSVSTREECMLWGVAGGVEQF